MICAFFGNRDVYLSAQNKKRLEDLIEKLIVEEVVTHFWVCREGLFDRTAKCTVLQFKRKYPYITIEEIGARRIDPEDDNFFDPSTKKFYDYYIPEEVSLSLSRFAICRRNDYILKHADIFICHVFSTCGKSYEYMKKAEKKGKRVINLCDLD